MVTAVTSTGSERLSASFVHQVDPEADEGADESAADLPAQKAGDEKPKRELMHLYR